MTKDYWLDRWKHNETGFHQDDINAYLIKYWHTLQLEIGTQIFVPLCGKTYDMVWLHNQGHSVLGVELSILAIKAFYEEKGWIPSHLPGKLFDSFTVNNINILHGDFFNLAAHDLANVRAVYDRASLVALSPETRFRYTQHILNILPSTTQILLVSLNYPQPEMQGPPFAVSPDEIIALFQNYAKIQLLEQVDILEENPRFQQRGLNQLQENIFLLTLNRTKK